MTILYDVFITDPEMEKELTHEERVLFNEIIAFFEQRLQPLKEAIEKEESANPEKNSCTIIHLLPPQEQFHLPREKQDQSIRISSHGYSPELKQKMEGSFNNNDFILLNEKLENMMGGLMN